MQQMKRAGWIVILYFFHRACASTCCNQLWMTVLAVRVAHTQNATCVLARSNRAPIMKDSVLIHSCGSYFSHL